MWKDCTARVYQNYFSRTFLCTLQYIYLSSAFFYMCQSNLLLFTDAEIEKKKKKGRRYAPSHWEKGEAIPSVLKEGKMQTTQRLPSTQSKRNHFSECFFVWHNHLHLLAPFCDWKWSFNISLQTEALIQDLNVVGNEEYRQVKEQGNQTAVELERKSWTTSECMLSKELRAYMTENYMYLKYAFTKCQPDSKLFYRGTMSLNSQVIICVPGALLSSLIF